MDKNKLKEQIKRLVDEAGAVAPSISFFEQDKQYGRVTDQNFYYDAFISWKMEAKAIFNQLSNSNSDIFSDLYKEYQIIEKESKRWHSKSIFVHRVQQLLTGAFSLIDSPIISNNSPINIKSSNIKIEKDYAFIAMPMDPNDHQLIDVLDAVKEAAKRCGVKAERVDEPQSNERITDRIIDSIQKAEFVIVDLSKSRPNVFFEAGYAHGLGKIPIYFAKHGTTIEFDLKDYPVLFYHNLRELKESIEKRIKGLKAKK